MNSVPDIAQALELSKESAFTKSELETYDKYWDTIPTETTLIADTEGKIEGNKSVSKKDPNTINKNSPFNSFQKLKRLPLKINR